MTRRQQRDRIEAALASLDAYTRYTLGLNAGGQRARSTYAGLLADAFAPELACGREAEATVARVRNAVRRLPADGTVPVRTILDALRTGAEVTAPDRLQVLLDRACRALSPDESAAFRGALADQQQRIAEVRALHATEFGNEYGGLECAVCREVWPCATIAALDGPDAAPPDRTQYDEHKYLTDRLTQAERQLALTQARIAGLHDGEEPYEDDAVVPTPAQWMWRWNRATPQRRQEIAALVLADYDIAAHCRIAHPEW